MSYQAPSFHKHANFVSAISACNLYLQFVVYALYTKEEFYSVYQPMPPDQLHKLKHYKDVLHRMIPYLTVSKERVPREFNQDKVEAFEKQIVNIMETFKRRKQPPQPALPPQQQGGQAPPPAQQQLLSQIQQQDNKHVQKMPVTGVGQSTVSALQPNSLATNLGPTLQQSGIPPLQQNGANSGQPTATSMQSNSLRSPQQGGVTSLPANWISAMQQGGLSTLQAATEQVFI